MTKERAQYILDNRLPYGGLKFAFKPAHRVMERIYPEGITMNEDYDIRELWATMPGSSCYYDALLRIAKGQVPVEGLPRNDAP